MFYLMKYAHRANRTTPFYGMSSNAAAAAGGALIASYPAFPAYQGLQQLMEQPAQLHAVTIEKWQDKATYDAWAAANAAAMNAYNAAREAYGSARGITVNEVGFESAAVIF